MSRRSNFEKQVEKYIISLTTNVLVNDRQQIKPLELDLYLPYLKLAFECNGEYYHKDQAKESRKYNMCKNKNIDLYFIWYSNWHREQYLVKYLIRQLIEERLKYPKI